MFPGAEVGGSGLYRHPAGVPDAGVPCDAGQRAGQHPGHGTPRRHAVPTLRQAR